MHPATVWEHLPCDDDHARVLTRALNVHPVVARLLVLRGFAAADEASDFLNPSLDQLHDPFLLTDLQAGVDRLLAAIARRERIAVHGDYDVDGITSTVILRRMIEMLDGEVVHFIPERLRDGYGLQPEAIELLHGRGVRVVVTVDCGIRSREAGRRARELGVDLVITDHHEPERELPPALAVINPRRHDCSYPDKDLAGVGVALKMVHGLCVRSGRQRWLPGFLKLAAIGTVADVVPLRGENRVIARLGLEQLTRGPHTTGLQALLDVTGLTAKKIGSYEVGFVLAPRVNAAGRMNTPDLATRLLLAAKPEMSGEARRLAERLDAENTKRREEEADVLRDARGRIAKDPTIAAQNALVVWAEGWHRGVIGIVASKLVDEFHRPVVVVSVDGETAYGSGRSIRGFDLLAGLEHCADLFDRFGGHRQAAGLTLPAARLPALRTRLAAYANERLAPHDLVPHLAIDARLPLADIDARLLAGLAALEPFGAGNRRPVFHAGAVEVVDGPRIIKNRHMSMTVRQGGARFRGMAWRAADRQAFVRERSAALDLAFSLTENTFRGNTFIELSVADVK